MRLIDADRLKEKVLEWLPSDPCGIEEKEHPIETDIVVSLMMEIEEAPTVSEWIPASERLPSESGWYFVTVQGTERVSDMVWYYHESHEWNGVSETQKVLAWMPLPEPYKGGDEA